MNIEIDEKKVDELVEKHINERIDKSFDVYIKNAVEERLSTIAHRISETSNDSYDLMKKTIERIVREEVKRRLDEMNFFTEEKLTEISKGIALDLSFKISHDITEIVSSHLAPVEDEEDEF